MENLYAIVIKEIAEKTVLIKGENSETALEKVEQDYNNSEIMLTYDNLTETDIALSPNWKDGLFTGNAEMKKLYEEIKN